MANQCVPAAGEALPSSADPIIAAIRDYRNGVAAFNAIKEDDWDIHGGEEAVIATTYAAPMDVLDEWDRPAETMGGVIDALRFALEEAKDFATSQAVPRMIAAALGYLQTAHPNRSCIALLDLMNHRKEAMRLDLDAWNKVGDVEDSGAMDALPLVRVQLGKLRHGYDDEGNPIEEPIWGHSAEQVRTKMQKDFDAWMTFMVPKSGPIREKNVAEWDKAIQAKVNELATLQAEADRIKQESGYAEALSIAQATTAAVKRIDRAIIAFVPRTLDEAVTLASWVIEARKEEYTHLEDEDFALVLGSIASATVPAAQESAA